MDKNPIKVVVLARNGEAIADLCRWLEEVSMEARRAIQFHLIGPAASTLKTWAAGNDYGFTALESWSLSAVASTLDRVYSDFQPDLIHVADYAAQRGAVWWQFWRSRPLMLIRSWHPGAEVPKQGRFSRWFYNRQTSLTLFADAKTREAYQKEGMLKLEHLVTLDIPFNGREDRAAVLCHTYFALTRPVRTDGQGRAVYDASPIRLSYVTHFYCNQKSADSVFNLLRRYETYRPEVLDHMHFVIVDDGSPMSYEVPDFKLNLTWLRIKEDISWNQTGARNLGITYAKSDPVIVTDMDHEFPESTLAALIRRSNPAKTIYKFYRRKVGSGKPQHAHPNIFFLSRGHFMRHGGYDEEFSGNYGSEDVRFVKYHKAMGTRIGYLPRSVWCFDRTDINRDKAYHSLVRDLSLNSPVDSRKRFELAFFGDGAGHSRMFLDFHWEIVKEIRRPVFARPPLKRWWMRGWLWRQVFQP